MRSKAARVAEEAVKKLRKARERHRNVAKVLGKVKGEINQALGDLKTTLDALTSP